MLDSYPDVLTVPQMQEALQIGKTKAYTIVHSGALKHLLIGRQIRIPKIYLLEYLNGVCYNAGLSDTGLRERSLFQ